MLSPSSAFGSDLQYTIHSTFDTTSLPNALPHQCKRHLWMVPNIMWPQATTFCETFVLHINEKDTDVPFYQ